MTGSNSGSGGAHSTTHAGVRWHCAGDPANPVVVLLHPIATTGAVWHAQVAAWADRFYIVALDLPGHGGSAALGAGADIADYAAAIAASLRAGGIEHAGIVGLSIGSMIAQRLAADHAALVGCVVLANGAAWTPEAASLAWGERIADARTHGMASLRKAMLQRWFTADFLRDAPEIVTPIGAMIDATSVEGFVAAADAIARLDNRDALPRIACPTLVIAGTADVAVPPSLIAPIAAAVPAARYVALPAPHLANVEAAVRFNQEIGAFLDVTIGARA